MKKIISLLLMFTLVFSIAGCSDTKKETKTPQLKTVHVAEVAHTLFYAPFYVALGNKYFEEEGLKIDLQTVPGGDKTMTALLSNAADIALVGPETSIYVQGQNAKDPVHSFAQVTQTDGTFLVARKNPGTFDWSQIKGSTFLGQRQGGMPQMVGEYVLKSKGINPQKDTKLIQNIDFANLAPAYLSGTGDYVQLFEPTASTFEKDGKGTVVASFGVESGKVPYTCFMAKESYIKKQADNVTAYTKALYKAQQWVNEHSASEIATVVTPYFKDTPNDIMVSSINRYKSQGSYATDPMIDTTEWSNLLSIMKEAGVLKADAPYKELVDPSFANNLLK